MSVCEIILGFVARFRRDDEGAVTTDWVLLTALIIGLALSSHVVWRSAAGNLSEEIAATASDFEIKTSFD